MDAAGVKQAVAWQQRKELGMFQAVWQTVRQVVFSPGKFFDNLEVKDSYKEPYLFYLIIAFSAVILQILYTICDLTFGSGAGKLPQNVMVITLFFMFGFLVVVAFVGAFVSAAVLHVGVLTYGGRAGFKATFNVAAYASAITILSVLFSAVNFIPVIGTPLVFAAGLIAGAWSIVMIIKGVKRMHRLSTARAALAYFLNPLVIALLIIIAVIGLLAGIAIPNLLRARVDANDYNAEASIRTISTALESYAAANNGYYPREEYELRSSNPPFLSQPYHNQTINGYRYSVITQPDRYEVVAAPEKCLDTGTKIFIMDTGGKLTSKSCE